MKALVAVVSWPAVSLKVSTLSPMVPVLPRPANVATPFTARTRVVPVSAPESIETSIEMLELPTVFPDTS